MVTLMTSREFNQRTSAAKRATARGPVIITDRGHPEHVLLAYEDYAAMTSQPQSALEYFRSLPDTSHIDVEFPRSHELPRAAEFG